ncbi:MULTISPECIES: DUF7332 family protein [Halorubrum]|uniref:Uncharacterized protein n=1 Tax=Halorubrum hochstenium ATCC 700873 TaxID=1227481 RepID=M0FSA0_9EURY|nr:MULTISPECIES: hypothetical protein [Halorubrum]ELZ61429.1 hypothetical protein C467_01386 [Halorubrum hochstenium ATCC 700873]
MTRSHRARVGVLALALLLVAASVGGGAVAGGASASASGTANHVSGAATHASVASDGPETVGPGLDGNGSEVGPITRCFTGEGYPISIGGEGGATMEAVLHLSVLTDSGAGNEFGLETAGSLDGEPIVTLAAGVRLTAREAIANGVDPFAAFDVLYTYDLRLPMFEGAVGDAGYEDDGSPIDSSAGAVAC